MTTATPQTAPLPPSRAGLIFFGISHICLACLCALFSLLGVVSVAMNPANPAAPARSTVPAVFVYLAAAAWFLVLGIGSIRVRRWARALIVAQSWIWLAGGIVSLVVSLLVLPGMFRAMPLVSSSALSFVIAMMAVFIGFFGVIIPFVFLLFYNRRSLEASVQRLDPVVRWTDRVPVSVLTLSLLLGLGGAGILIGLPMHATALPMGHSFITGTPAALLMAFFAVASGAIAWGLAQLRPAAWWACLVFFVAGIAYGLIVLPTVDYETWFRAMGTPPNPAYSQVFDFYRSPLFLVCTAIFWLGYLGWLFYVKRYFRGRASS